MCCIMIFLTMKGIYMSKYQSEIKMFRSVGILLNVEFAPSDSNYENYDKRQPFPLLHHQ